VALGTTCPLCGEPIALAEVTGGRHRVTCGHCDAPMDLIVSVDGGETIFQPQLLTEDLPASTGETTIAPAGAATRPVGSATTLLEATPGIGGMEDVATVQRACLVVGGAPPGCERLRLDAPRTVVGREGADLDIADAAISSRHFEVERRGGEFFLRDLGSSNGTFVNGHRVRAVQLRPWDTIRAGRTTFTFRIFEAIAL
jgi:hypothetical protein